MRRVLFPAVVGRYYAQSALPAVVGENYAQSVPHSPMIERELCAECVPHSPMALSRCEQWCLFSHGSLTLRIVVSLGA